MPIAWFVNTIGSHTSLGDLVSWNQPATSSASTTTVQQAQQTLAQSPAQIVSALAPGNTYYGVAPTNDSLLGNVGTSAALSALSQVNASRTSSTEISPYTSVSAALDDAQSTLSSAKSQVVLSALATSGSYSNPIPSEYYVRSYSAIMSTLAPSLTFSTDENSSTAGLNLPTT